MGVAKKPKLKKFKLWGTTLVHVVKIVEAESIGDAMDRLDGSLEITNDERVKARSAVGLVRLEIDDEWFPCARDEVIEL